MGVFPASLLFLGLLLGAHGVSRAYPVTPPKPVAGWLFDEGAGSVAEDFFGGNDGTLGAAAGWSADVPRPSYAANHSLAVTGAAGSSVVTGGRTVGTTGSFQLWAYRDFTTSGWRYILDSSKDGQWAARTLLAYAGASGFNLQLNNVSIGYTDTGLILPNEWTHIVVTWDTSLSQDREKVYRNGTLYTTFNASFNSASPDMFRIGARYPGSEGWIGRIDEVAFWDTALTPDQVSWLYEHSLHDLPEPGTLALWAAGMLAAAIVRTSRARGKKSIAG